MGYFPYRFGGRVWGMVLVGIVLGFMAPTIIT